jgi:hypothetical protein
MLIQGLRNQWEVSGDFRSDQCIPGASKGKTYNIEITNTENDADSRVLYNKGIMLHIVSSNKASSSKGSSFLQIW